MYEWERELLDFSELVGQVLVKVEGDIGSGTIDFYCEDGSEYQLYHEQDCCESVRVEDIVGDFEDLIGFPILFAREDTEYGGSDEYGESSTWTFYNIGTNKGVVTLRWLGESNGYYSESVSFYKRK